MGCQVNERQMLLGSKRVISLIVTSHSNYGIETVDIDSASYELRLGSEIMDSGSCTINANKASAIIYPTKKGLFTLDYTLHIDEEIIVERLTIRVK